MIVKDIKNNTVCLLDKQTGQVSLKYKGLKTLFIIPVGSTYIIERNSTITNIYHKTETEYQIESHLIN